MGKMVEVEIFEAGKHFMRGQPVSEAKVFTPSIRRPYARGEVSGLTEVSSTLSYPLYLSQKRSFIILIQLVLVIFVVVVSMCA